MMSEISDLSREKLFEGVFFGAGALAVGSVIAHKMVGAACEGSPILAVSLPFDGGAANPIPGVDLATKLAWNG